MKAKTISIFKSKQANKLSYEKEISLLHPKNLGTHEKIVKKH